MVGAVPREFCTRVLIFYVLLVPFRRWIYCMHVPLFPLCFSDRRMQKGKCTLQKSWRCHCCCVLEKWCISTLSFALLQGAFVLLV